MLDEQYLTELASGNESAFDSLVFRYHKPLFGYLYRLLHDEKQAEDLVQETFLKIYQEGKRGFIPEKFKPWMYKIATNRCKDYWKKASTKREFATEGIYDNPSQVYHIIDHQIERKWMMESLNQLSLDYRTALYLRFYQDLKYEEIALTLEIPLNTVKTRISRGLKQLEKILQENEGKEERKYE